MKKDTSHLVESNVIESAFQNVRLGQAAPVNRADTVRELNEMNLRDPEDQKRIQQKVEIIHHERIIYTKPIAIIYNPNSGKKRDLLPLIKLRLEQSNVPFEILLSLRAFMTWELAHDLEMDRYSALVAVGGDGTYHEVVNGMMHRKDGRQMPVAFIPNGSGNDTLRGLEVFDLDKAMDYIIKGDIIKIDQSRLVIDYERESDVPEEKRVSNVRYQLINSSYTIPGRVNAGAGKWKWCCCNAYQVSALIEFCNIKHDLVDIYVDEVLLYENLATCLMVNFNGKFGGNGMLLNPNGLINDGLIELIVVTEKLNFKRLADLMESAMKKGAIHHYQQEVKCLRGRTMKIVNKNPPKDKHAPEGTRDMQVMGIDGEVMHFKDYVKYECLYQGLEVIVDFDMLMGAHDHFVKK